MFRFTPILLAAAAIGGCSVQAQPTSAANPVVVELFQSQGCSSCPPANAAVNAIAGRPDVLALSFAVTYWDKLGWKDVFADPAYTRRQWEYARAGGRGNVATPQVIVNGRSAIVGGNPAQLAQTIRREGPAKGGPTLSVAGNAVRIGAGKAASPAIVWLVRYDPKVRQVAIRAGENGGRTLPHRNIVRQLAMLGKWRGTAATLPLPAPREPGLRTAILTQAGTGGRITGALKL